jgi:hypothetical protein
MKRTIPILIWFLLFISCSVWAGTPTVSAGGVDDHTLALWLFDDSPYPNVILTDASLYQHDLRLLSGYAKWWRKTEGLGDIQSDARAGDVGESGLRTSGRGTDEMALHVAGEYGLIEGKFGGGLRLPLGEKGEIAWPDHRQRYATEFLRDRGGHIPERLNIGYLDWTIEFWYRAAGEVTEKASVFELRNELHPRTRHMVNALMLDRGRSGFLLVSKTLDDEEKFDLELPIPSDSEKLNGPDWHHYAFTYTADERQVRHFVDGKLQALPQKGGLLPMMSRLDKFRIDNRLNGVLDEMRISDVVRYTGDFTLPGSFSLNYGVTPREVNKPNGPPLLFGPDRDPDGVVELGSRRHLFIDEALVEKMDGVDFTVNPPGHYEVTSFRNTKPWEPSPRFGSTIADVCSVWDEGDEIRMLYTNGGMWGGKPHAVCYATSRDGLNWDKPVLGLKSWGGSNQNNIVLTDACQGSVLKDPNPAVSPEERYKYAAWNMYWGYYVFTSPDGIHWKRNETSALPIDPDGSISFYWDDQRGVYRGYVRSAFDTGHRRRVVQITAPEFLKPWPFEPVDYPDLGDLVLARPVSGELPLIDTGGQIYRFKAHKYEWAPDTYLAFPWRYIADGNVRPGSFLMVSRDGVNWKRYEPPYYFTPGWELNGRKVDEALTEHGMIRRGDEIWQYGTVRFTVHGGVLYGGEEKEGGVHDRLLRLSQRLDGFVSLDAGSEVGEVVTRPLIFRGGELELNVKIAGSIRVELLDQSGKPFDGFSLDDCPEITVDQVDHTVTWKSGSDVSGLAGKVVQVRFELRNAKLYALQFK